MQQPIRPPPTSVGLRLDSCALKFTLVAAFLSRVVRAADHEDGPVSPGENVIVKSMGAGPPVLLGAQSDSTGRGHGASAILQNVNAQHPPNQKQSDNRHDDVANPTGLVFGIGSVAHPWECSTLRDQLTVIREAPRPWIASHPDRSRTIAGYFRLEPASERIAPPNRSVSAK